MTMHLYPDIDLDMDMDMSMSISMSMSMSMPMLAVAPRVVAGVRRSRVCVLGRSKIPNVFW